MEENNGGLSIFGTDFASKRFSWAGNLYQKWENICRENIMVQDPSKFVDAVGEQFRKICEEVADDWLNPFSDGCVKGPVSDLSLEQDVIAKICQKSMIDHHESPIDEGSLISISSQGDTSVAPLPIIGQGVREEVCQMLNKRDTMVLANIKVCNCSSEMREDHEKMSPKLVISPGPPSSADGVLLSEFPGNITERGSGPSDFAIPTEENGASASEEEISSIHSIPNLYEEKSNSNEPELPLTPRDLDASYTKYCDMHADTSMQEKDEFEDVKLEDLFEEKKEVAFWEHGEEYELALVPHRAMKNRSYKKKLKDMFHSNFYSPKKKSNNNGGSFYGATGMVLEMRDITTVSSVSSGRLESRGLSTGEPCEPDWELI